MAAITHVVCQQGTAQRIGMHAASGCARQLHPMAGVFHTHNPVRTVCSNKLCHFQWAIQPQKGDKKR